MTLYLSDLPPAVAAQIGIKNHKAEQRAQAFVSACWYAMVPMPVREFPFDAKEHGGSGRKWRADFAWPDHKVLLEVEGIVYPKKGSGEYRAGGRHASVRGLSADIDKYLQAARLGYSVIRVLPKHLEDGTALSVIEAVIG